VGEPTATVELFGLARHRAGRAELTVTGRTIAELARRVGAECPGLGGLITDHGLLSGQYLFSLDGERFIDDPAVVVPTGSRLLILGADAGG
jgi:sulfur-carrier protein